MTTLIRLAVSFVFVVAAAGTAAPAQVVSAGLPNGSTAAELAAFLAAQPKWTFSTAVRTSAGYNDNLLLGFADEERSPFVRGNVEFFAMRIPRDRFDFSILAEIEGTRFTSGRTVDDNSKVWLQTDPGYQLTETLKLSFPLTGYYYDQVYDQSDTEIERIIAEVKVAGVLLGPTVRWDFRRDWWVEAKAHGQRKRYDERHFDGDVGEGGVDIGWSGIEWLEVRLHGGRRWRQFDSRAQYSAAGRELAGTRLKISEREAELQLLVTWDEAGNWTTTTRAGVLHYRDNGSGFFNFRERRIAHELEWDATPWRVRVGGSVGRADYGVQTVGVGIDPPGRIRDDYSGEFLLERKLSDRWMVFGRYLWERSRSNDHVASYQMNEGLLGVRLSWDK